MTKNLPKGFYPVSMVISGSHDNELFSYRQGISEGAAERFTLLTNIVDVMLEFTLSGELVEINPVIATRKAVNLDYLELEYIAPEGAWPCQEAFFFKNGFQSWTETRSFCFGQRQRVSFWPAMRVLQDNERNLPRARKNYFTSDMYALCSVNEQIMLIGQASPFGQYFYVHCDMSRSDGRLLLRLIWDFGGMKVHGKLCCDQARWYYGTDAHQLLNVWTSSVAPKKKISKAPRGWCSWYYYYTRVASIDILENLDSCDRQKPDWSHFLLDDGYQHAVGDWLELNEKFPADQKTLTAAIREKSMSPGIWLAPFIARRGSKVFREHRDWFLSDEKGRPVKAGWNPNWGGDFYALDTTNPGFQEYLKQVIVNFTKEQGWQLLKLDFIYAASLYGRAYNQSLSSAERLGLGLDIIRKTAGKNVFLLGCGSPLSPAIGRVDAMRIGPDVAPFWFAWFRYYFTGDPHALCTRFAVRSIINRAHQHRSFWINDPDCLLVRDHNTRLTAEERQTLANSIIITGGMFLVSDRLRALPEFLWQEIARVGELVDRCDGGSVVVPGLLTQNMPDVVYNDRGYLALFNFRKRQRMEWFVGDVCADGVSLRDVRTGAEYTVAQGRVRVSTVGRHGSVLLEIAGRKKRK